jgi:hypothetical protein
LQEKVEYKYKSGKKEFKPWQHDRPVEQIVYEDRWLKTVVNPDTNEFYPARDKDGNAIPKTGAKHVVT